MTTLSFHKVMFSADEVLDLIADIQEDHDIEVCGCAGLEELEHAFIALAEERSRS